MYCKWQRNTKFSNLFSNPNPEANPCRGSISCGWGTICPFLCVDSPLPFQLKSEGGSLVPVSCLLAEKIEKNGEKHLTCSNEGQFVTHCPKACDKCSEHECSDAEGVFFLGDGGEKKLKCSRLKMMIEEKRIKKCEKTKVAQTCRETCKLCE